MRDSEEGATHSYGDGCQPPHEAAVQSLDPAERDRRHAANLRLEAAAIEKTYWAARASHDRSPAECEQLERCRWECIREAEQIEAQLSPTAPSN